MSLLYNLKNIYIRKGIKMSSLKELQEFPAIYTFKIVIESNTEYKNSLLKIFDLNDREVSITEKESSAGKYISFSVTTIVMDYSELECFYKDISKLQGLKFYV